MGARIGSTARVAAALARGVLRLLVLAAPLAFAAPASGAQGLRVYLIDVGQGDSTLLIFPDGQTMLIDAGEAEAAGAVIGLLDRLGIRALDFAVASHGHPDHIGGFGALAEAGYLDPSTTGYAWSGRQWGGIRWRRVRAGDLLCDCGGATVTCYAAGARVAGGAYVRPKGNNNARSIVLNISYHGFDYLSGGDLTGAGHHPDVETPLGDALAGLGIRIDVYKVHHHGSRSSSNLHFLKRIMPEFATISVGADNPYGHPTRAVLNRLNHPEVGVRRIFLTERGCGATAHNVTVARGQILVATDGLRYTISSEGPGSAAFSFGPYPVDEFAGFWPMFSGVGDLLVP